MTTRINRKVKGSTMQAIFDNAETFSIRYYYAEPRIKNYNPEKEYTYGIVIRHPEGTDAENLFDTEIEQHENTVHQ